MKKTGIVRKVDAVGRVVIPSELRDQLCMQEDDSIEIYFEEEGIVLRKFRSICFFCGSDQEVIPFKNSCLCKKCRCEIVEQQIE